MITARQVSTGSRQSSSKRGQHKQYYRQTVWQMQWQAGYAKVAAEMKELYAGNIDAVGILDALGEQFLFQKLVEEQFGWTDEPAADVDDQMSQHTDIEHFFKKL